MDCLISQVVESNHSDRWCMIQCYHKQQLLIHSKCLEKKKNGEIDWFTKWMSLLLSWTHEHGELDLSWHQIAMFEEIWPSRMFLVCPTGGGLHGQRRAVHLETTRRGRDDRARGSSAGERTQPSHRRGGNVCLAIPALQTGSWHLSRFTWMDQVSDFDIWPLKPRTASDLFGLTLVHQ